VSRGGALLAFSLVFVLGSIPLAYARFSDDSAKTLGVGRIQSTAVTPVDPQNKFALESLESTVVSATVEQIVTPLGREVVIKEPEVLALAGDDPSTMFSGEWMTGTASAYALGNDGVDSWTANGSILDENSFGVAVPAEWAYLLGSTVEIRYGEVTVTGYINDTGAFLRYGRSLDLQPGIWKAFGCNNEYEWGVRTIQWRIVG